MQYEIRTYNCLPNKVPVVLDQLRQTGAASAQSGELVGCWYTDIGPLHQIIYIRRWADLDMPSSLPIAGAFPHFEADWPPDTFARILDVQAEMYSPMAFCPALSFEARGPVYEMRTYTVLPGRFHEVAKRWQAALPARLELSRLLLALISQSGSLDRFVHIWPYQSLQHRTDARAKAVATGIWPPPGSRDFSLRQENKILLPVDFSPLSQRVVS